MHTSYTYDSLSRLLSVLHQAGTVTLDGASYTYDNAGNRVSKTNSLNNTTENYTYDPLYQLTQVAQGLTTTESYTYDAVGNRLSSLGMSPYAYNSSNELTSTPSATFTYDANGNTLTKVDSSGTTTYGWDFENRLTSVALPAGAGTVTFKYDPFGRRIQKSSASGTTNYVYDGSNSVEEADQTGAELAHYSQGTGIDEPLAAARGGAVGFYEQDGLGSVTSLTGSTGAVLNSYTYDAFGNVAASTGSFVNPFLYTGRELDSETGLRYYRARYYDPSSGRFLSEDPARFDAGNNFYDYVRNNPVKLRDPSGMNPAQALPWVRPAGRTAVTICVESGVCETIIVGAAAVSVLAVVGYGVTHAPPIESDWRKRPQFQCGKKSNRDIWVCDELYQADLAQCAEIYLNPNNPDPIGYELCALRALTNYERCVGWVPGAPPRTPMPPHRLSLGMGW